MLVAGYGVPQLLGKLTVILGGIGVVESSMVGLYTVLGVPNAVAIVAVLGYASFRFRCRHWLVSRSFPILSAGRQTGRAADSKKSVKGSLNVAPAAQVGKHFTGTALVRDVVIGMSARLDAARYDQEDLCSPEPWRGDKNHIEIVLTVGIINP